MTRLFKLARVVINFSWCNHIMCSYLGSYCWLVYWWLQNATALKEVYYTSRLYDTFNYKLKRLYVKPSKPHIWMGVAPDCYWNSWFAHADWWTNCYAYMHDYNLCRFEFIHDSVVAIASAGLLYLWLITSCSQGRRRLQLRT